MRMCKELDSELVILSESQGFNNVLYHNLNKLSEDKPMFKILFSYAAKTHRESIIGKISSIKSINSCLFSLISSKVSPSSS